MANTSSRKTHGKQGPLTAPPAGSKRVLILHGADSYEAIDFCRGVAQYRPRGGAWRLHSIAFNPWRPRFPETRLAKLRFDGIIMMPGYAPLLETLAEARPGLRIVDVDDAEVDRRPLPFHQVRLDHRDYGWLAGRHLLDRGFRRLLFLGDDAPWSHHRAAGLNKAARESGADVRVAFAPQWRVLLTKRWIVKQLSRVQHPVGVFACNDTVGALVIDVAEAQGWTVPTRIAVIGVDDRITECIRVQPPLSTMSLERLHGGYEAARMLDEQFNNPGVRARTHWIRPARVIERESTSAHVYHDDDVVQGLTVIRREACTGLTVDQLLDRLNVSRSTLERKFSRIVGRSPGEEIRRVRLDEVKRRLEQTDKSLAEIAMETGFASTSSLSHCFRNATDVTPDAYRRATVRRTRLSV